MNCFQLFVISHVNFMVNGKSESAPRDQAFPFLDVYCLLLLGKSQLFHAIWIHENCFELFLPAIFLFEIFSTWMSRLPFAVNVTLNLSIVKKITYAHRGCDSRLKVEKLIFSAFSDGMETLYTQCMLFGYFLGNPGLVKMLCTTEPHPTKPDCNFVRQLVFSESTENLCPH